MIASLEALLALLLILTAIAFFTMNIPPVFSILTYVHYHDSVTIAIETGDYTLSDCPVERYFLTEEGTLERVCFKVRQ